MFFKLFKLKKEVNIKFQSSFNMESHFITALAMPRNVINTPYNKI